MVHALESTRTEEECSIKLAFPSRCLAVTTRTGLVGRQKHGNFDDYTELTARQSQRGRHSKLGNNVFKVVPRNLA